MPPKRKANKRKAGEAGRPVAEPAVGGNVVDFDAIIRASNVLDTPRATSQECQTDPEARLTDQADFLGSFNTSVPNASCVGSGSGINRARCASDEVFGHVPLSLREKIINGQFVNLSLLLKGSAELDEFCSGGSICVSADGSIETRPRDCKSKIPNIERWTDAFIIYMSIYIRTHKEEASDLLKYMSNIREAASKQGGFAWRTYDEQFRLRQETSPSSWAVINTDLWWRCSLVRSVEGPRETNYGGMPINAVPQGPVAKSYPCLDFNRGTCRWSNCRFGHICSNCGASHAAFNCTKQAVSEGQSQFFRPSNAVNRRFPRGGRYPRGGQFRRN